MKILVVEGFAAMLTPAGLLMAAEPVAPQPLPADAPKLAEDVTVVVAGSSIRMSGYGCEELPKWTGGYDWCARQVKMGRFKMLAYATPQASSQTFRDWPRAPAHKPPYGSGEYLAARSDEERSRL